MTATRTLGRLLERAWTRLHPPMLPDHPDHQAPARPHELPPIDHRARWLGQLSRTRYALEQTRIALIRDGWTGAGWYDGQAACVIGALLRMVDDPDQVPTVKDAWHCVDELYEAVHESRGQASAAPGRAYPQEERRARLRGVTAWNDAPGRTRDEVVEVLDRAVARTIAASCR